MKLVEKQVSLFVVLCIVLISCQKGTYYAAEVTDINNTKCLYILYLQNNHEYSYIDYPLQSIRNIPYSTGYWYKKGRDTIYLQNNFKDIPLIYQCQALKSCQQKDTTYYASGLHFNNRIVVKKNWGRIIFDGVSYKRKSDWFLLPKTLGLDPAGYLDYKYHRVSRGPRFQFLFPMFW